MKKIKRSRKRKSKKTARIVGIIFLLMIFIGVIGKESDTAANQNGSASEIWVQEGSERNSDEESLIDTEEALYAEEMQIHFIDVGQGDATLIMCGGEAMLIDAGDDAKGTAVQNYLQKQGVTRLKYLILTHTDADHIGGSDVIISKFPTDNVFIGDFPKDNKVYADLINALTDQGFPWSTPLVGSTYSLGRAKITILAPNKEYDDPNNCSIALLVENGEDSFLFTGDAEEEAEADILKNGLSIDCDVFKAGHHGSKTSNSAAFLEAASPETVVISCGEDNSYGHPHAGPLNAFRSMGIKIYRTDEQGSLVATSTGKEISWNAAPSDSWKAGEPRGSSRSESGQREEQKEESITYVCNTNPGSMKFHYSTCESVEKIKEENKKSLTGTRDEVIAQGFTPCGNCNP